MNPTLRLWVLLTVLLSFNRSSATHIVGGELNYHQIKAGEYEITLRLFMDCVNGDKNAIALDSIAYIGFYNAITHQLLDVDTIRRGPSRRVEELHYNCITFTSNACVDEYLYIYNKKISIADTGIIISYQRCCRNHTISNIVNPGNTGSTYWTLIPPQKSTPINSSPAFKKLPPNFLCTNAPLVFDHSAIDADNDSLVYSLIIPYSGASSTVPQPKIPSKPPYSPIVLKPAFSTLNFMNNVAPMKIDSLTGELRVFPDQTGQFVVGILAEEFRNGVKIGETHRDYQFNVQDCIFDVQSYFTNNPISCSDTVRFNNLSSPNAAYLWDFGDTLISSDTSNQKNGKWFYKQPGSYKVTLTVTKTECSDTFYNWIKVLKADSVLAKFDLPNKIACDKLSITPIQKSTPAPYRYWDMGDSSGFFTNSDPSIYLYSKPGVYIVSLWVTDSTKCNIQDEYTDTIKVYQTPKAHFIADTVFCSPLVNVKDLSVGTGTYEWKWNDSIFPKSEDTFSLVAPLPGNYLLSLKINNGPCADSMETPLRVMFALHGSALFQVSPRTGCAPLKIDITQSVNAGLFVDGYSGDGVYFGKNIPSTYTYLKSGDYDFKIFFSDTLGCRDADSFVVPIKLRKKPEMDFETYTDPCEGKFKIDSKRKVPGQKDYWQLGVNAPWDTLLRYNISKKGDYFVRRQSNVDSLCFDSSGRMISIYWNDLSELNLYNVFTPNDDDQLNRTFKISGLDSTCFTYYVTIYNRWGEIVYESRNLYNQWDGFMSNSWAPHPAGVYYVIYRFTSKITNKEETFSGTVTLIRD